MMKVKSKFKKCRKYRSRIFEKCLSPKYVLSEQRKKANQGFQRQKMITDYGKQLMEKQKLKFSYGLKEKQLKKYILEAIDSQNETFSEIYKNLETRLDNIIYKTGLAQSRAMARQMVSHGHFTINGRKFNIPSYNVKIGDEIGVREGSRDRSFFQNLDKKDLVKLPK